MLYNIKIAFRNLRHNGLYTVINIAGLAICLAVCTFILLWVKDEKSYDRFHKDAENIYMVIAQFKSDERKHVVDISPGLFAPVALQNFEEVTSYCRVRRSYADHYLLAQGIKTGKKSLLYADSTFFTFFQFPIIKGERQGLLQTPDDIVISEQLATELFSNNDPIGQTVETEGGKKLRVAAVMKNIPSNTYLPRADIICSHKSGPLMYTELLNNWGSCEFLSFLRLKPGTDTDRLAKQVTEKQTLLQEIRSYTLQPLVNMHLYTIEGEPAGIKTVNMFTWIALIMLIIACINYVNMVTARSSKRNREIGMKKILGIRKVELFFQLLTEAAILFIIALAISILLNTLLLPLFNQLSGKEIVLMWNDRAIWLIYGGIFLTVMVFAGIYPALTLLSFKPVNMFQGIQVKSRNALLRKILVVLQFAASLVMIVGTIVLQLQLKYIREKDLGYNKEHVFVCDIQGMGKHYNTVKTELVRNSSIQGVTGASGDITELLSSSMTDNWEGKTGNGSVMFIQEAVDTSFFDVMKIPLAEGQNFNTDTVLQVIINESCAQAMGLTKPIAGKWMIADDSRRIITGVVKDFHFKSLHQKVSPLVIFPRSSYASVLYVRTTAKEAGKAIAAVEKLWKQYNPNLTFSYRFMDETFDQMYRSDMRVGQLFGIFALIAILISCLGLFGLVTYTAEMKTKEIGIRKVLGAGIGDIVAMLSKEFLLLIVIAMLIAFPLAYYWLNQLLQDYAYHISISWWMFGLACLITIVLTLATVSFRSIKAATANPVNAIKTE